MMTTIETVILYFEIIIMTVAIARVATSYNALATDKSTYPREILSIRKKEFLFLLVACIPMIVFSSLRFQTGADYEQYVRNFEYSIYDLPKMKAFQEPLYVLSNVVVYLFMGNSPQVWIALMALITIVVMALALFLTGKKIDYSLFFLLYGCFAYLHSFNYIRQMAACSFILLGLVFLSQRKYVKFFIFIAVATMFHTSSMVFFLAIAFFLNKTGEYEKNEKKISLIMGGIILLMFFIILFIPQIIEILPFLRKYVESYFQNTELSLGIGWLIDIIPIGVGLVLRRKKILSQGHLGGILYYFSWLIIPFKLLGYYSYGAGRLFIPLGLLAIFIISLSQAEKDVKSIEVKNKRLQKWGVEEIRIDVKKLVIEGVFLIYFIYYFCIANNSGIIPYTFI